MRVRMLVKSIGHENHGAQFRGASPEFRQQIAVHVNVLNPLVVDDGMVVVRAAPADDRVDIFQFVFKRWNFLIQRDADRLRRFRIDMHLHRLAIQIARLYLPVLAFTLIWRQFHGVAIAEVECLVDVENGLHPVVAGGNIVETFSRIA